MSTSATVLATAMVSGLLAGIFVRPSWRLCAWVLLLAIAFLVLEIARASWLGTPFADLVHVITLSSRPEFQRHLGAMLIAYAAFLAAAVIALRVSLAQRKAASES